MTIDLLFKVLPKYLRIEGNLTVLNTDYDAGKWVAYYRIIGSDRSALRTEEYGYLEDVLNELYNLCKESNYLEPQIEPANEIPRGTSFFGDKITLPLSRVHKMFGAPIPPVSKTYYQWALKINDIPFLLYDYKLDEVPHLLDYVDWHIGTDSEEHSKFIAEELKKLFE